MCVYAAFMSVFVRLTMPLNVCQLPSRVERFYCNFRVYLIEMQNIRVDQHSLVNWTHSTALFMQLINWQFVDEWDGCLLCNLCSNFRVTYTNIEHTSYSSFSWVWWHTSFVIFVAFPELLSFSCCRNLYGQRPLQRNW